MTRKCNEKSLRSTRKAKEYIFENKFPTYTEIQDYLLLLSNLFKNHVKLEVIGKSYEGRDIYMIIISKFNGTKKRHAAFIEANIHAREWLANSTALYFINYIVANKQFLKLMDFYVVPCVNPDGYEYTHTKDRLWRKNRNPNCSSRESRMGVDLNRNFPYAYGEKGSSSDPSSFMYRGQCPLSEPETQAVAMALEKYARNIKLYIAIHSFGNVIMFPWGCTTEPIPDRPTLEDCGNKAKMAMKVLNGRRYKVGSAASTMYLLSGSSADYARGYHNIKFTYTIELQKCGKSGFTPSPKRIVEIGKETTVGILAMVKYVVKYYAGKQRRIDLKKPCINY